MYRFLIAVTIACSLFANQEVARAQYPWRSNAARTIQQPNSTRVQSRIPTPRARRANRLNPVLVSFANQQEGQTPVPQGNSVLSDGQPSVSDVLQAQPQANLPAVDPVAAQPQAIEPQPAPPVQTQPSMFQPVAQDSVVGQWVSSEPGLQVQSNAGEAPNYCNRNCRKPCCLGCERKLFGRNCNGLEIGGWLNLGYHNRNTGLLNNRKSDINLHQTWLYFDQQASRDAGWSLGYRADLIYGIDGQDFQAFGNSPTGAPSGWDNGWDYGSYGWAAPQLYVQIANCDWDVKLGKFLSPFGYESIQATNNFFYSRSFTSYNTEPYSLTGILGERRVSDTQSYLLGFTAGWDTGFENNNGGNLIVGSRRRLGEFVDVSFTASVGDTGYRDTGIFTSGVTKVQLTDSLRYVLQTDVANLRDAQEFGIVQYLFRDVNACLSLGTRLEWWKSDRFFGGPTRSTYGFTMGANYRANANLTLRPELRFDWGAAAAEPGEAIIGIDAVVTF